MFLYSFRGDIERQIDKQFKNHHDRNWAKHTRPILEAFFHAKYFLEMAVKYGKELDKVPDIQPSPSGWAALLELYGIRDMPSWIGFQPDACGSRGKSLPKR